MQNTTVSRRNDSGTLARRMQISRSCSAAIVQVRSALRTLIRCAPGMVSRKFPVRQRFFQISSRQPGMFAGDAFRARSLAVFDGIDERPVMLFRDGNDFLRSVQGFVHDDARAWRGKREPVDLLDRAAKDLVIGEVQDGVMESFVQIEVPGEALEVYVRDCFHGAIDLAQGFQLSGIVQTFGREPGGRRLPGCLGSRSRPRYRKC